MMRNLRRNTLKRESDMKIIRNFATSEDLIILRDLSKNCAHIAGTRSGIYSCGTTYSLPTNLYQRLIVASELPGGKLNGLCYSQFISYKKGGFVGAHKDWVFDASFTKELRTDADKATGPCKLYRINVMVDAASKGGELFVDGEEVKLNEGDALVFRPELCLHEVKPVIEGSRMIFTCGFHHKES